MRPPSENPRKGMTEIFTKIIDRKGREGRTERFVNLEVHVSDTPLEADLSLLDGTGRRNLRSHSNGLGYEAVAGTARISWKSDADREACLADHEQDEKRERRWQRVQEILRRMQDGEFPQFAHAYLHPSLTGLDDLMVIDGTRRMIAYLLLGRDEMPVDQAARFETRDGWQTIAEFEEQAL